MVQNLLCAKLCTVFLEHPVEARSTLAAVVVVLAAQLWR